MTEKLFTKYIAPVLDFNNYQTHRDCWFSNPCFFDKKMRLFCTNLPIYLTMSMTFFESSSPMEQKKSTQKPTQLSGGQRQRAALARALSHAPRILLLDEPLGALDALTRLEMQSLIERLWKEQGFTAILVTHDVSEAVQLADRIILLDQGHIAHQFQVNLPRPRQKTIAFAQLEQQVLDAVLAT